MNEKLAYNETPEANQTFTTATTKRFLPEANCQNWFQCQPRLQHHWCALTEKQTNTQKLTFITLLHCEIRSHAGGIRLLRVHSPYSKSKWNDSLLHPGQSLFVQLNTRTASMWSEFACLANQQPGGTIKKKSLCEFLKQMCRPCLMIIKSYFGYKINKPITCSHCLNCVSCSVHVVSNYYVRKGS